MKYLQGRQTQRGEVGLTYRASLRGESGVSVRRRVVHLWSGLGLPFFLMLFAVVSLKWSLPTVTFVTCSGGRVTLGAAESEICDRSVAVKTHFDPVKGDNHNIAVDQNQFVAQNGSSFSF